MQMVVVYLLPEDECGAQQDPRHVDGRLQVLGVGELAVDAHADGDGCELRALRRRRPRCTPPSWRTVGVQL